MKLNIYIDYIKFGLIVILSDIDIFIDEVIEY